MLQVKIKFRLKSFNLGWFSISFDSISKSWTIRAGRQKKLQINLQSATKWVDTLHPKVGFFTFYELQEEEI